MTMTKAEMQKQIELQAQVIQKQQELIKAQQEIIELQKRVDAMTPKVVADEEIFWHTHSGMPSLEAANSDDIEVVSKYHQWLTEFAQKHLKPYVNPKVFGEALNQMTRGLTQRIVDLEMKPAISNGRRRIKPTNTIPHVLNTTPLPLVDSKLKS
jgi:hypothetical protein